MPYESASRLFGAPGIGQGCAACKTPIEKTQLAMAVPTPKDKTFIFLHAGCFAIWDEERREGMTP